MRGAYDEVYVYTMGRDRETFILQHAVDAYAAQMATEDSKPIRVIFALIGLYLHVEKGFTGLQVQRVHMQLGRKKRRWPAVSLPPNRGTMTAVDVLASPEGAERDAAIDAWCRSVWTAYRESRATIIALLRECQDPSPD